MGLRRLLLQQNADKVEQLMLDAGCSTLRAERAECSRSQRLLHARMLPAMQPRWRVCRHAQELKPAAQLSCTL